MHLRASIDAARRHFEDYSYDADTARLFAISLNGDAIRDFGYAPSGQILQDIRQTSEGERRFDFDLNAHGRMVAVRENDVSVASYTYDVFEQRIAKTLTGQSSIHYHYDEQGRLISETDAATGAIIRDYVWIGLMPVATLGVQDVPTNENCDPALIADLRQRLADREERLVLVRDRIATLSGTVTTREERESEVAARLAALQATLDSVPETNTDRIDNLTIRIANLDARLTELDAAIDNLNTRIEDLNARELINKFQ